MPWPSSRDDELFGYVALELERQNTTLQLIASENFASPAVLEASGSVLTNKYAEGYPGKRYYGGNVHVDEVEDLARERVKALFGADHANVQPHSGANANMSVYQALLQPGDTVLGLSLDHGGHLTHGSPVNASGKLYDFVSYGLTGSDERIDMDELRDKARESRPKLIVAGATAYPRVIESAPLREIADEVGALLMFDAAHIAGLIAGGVHPSPDEYADIVTSTTHKTLRGPRGAMALTTKSLSRKYNSAVFPNMQGGPMQHAIAGKAVAFREAMQPEFKKYAGQVVQNAQVLATVLSTAGLRIVAGGTENHMLLVDTRSIGMTGRQAEEALIAAGLVVNKNTIPFDPESPMVTSGIRIGTPALTSRDLKAEDMENVAGYIIEALGARDDEAKLANIGAEVAKFSSRFPVPGLDF